MATVYTFNQRLRAKLKKVAAEHPDEVICKGESLDGGITYVLPRNWITVTAPRKISDEQRRVLSERAKVNLCGKGGDC